MLAMPLQLCQTFIPPEEGPVGSETGVACHCEAEVPVTGRRPQAR